MKKNRITIIALSLALMAGFANCGGDDEKSEPDNQQQQTTPVDNNLNNNETPSEVIEDEEDIKIEVLDLPADCDEDNYAGGQLSDDEEDDDANIDEDDDILGASKWSGLPGINYSRQYDELPSLSNSLGVHHYGDFEYRIGKSSARRKYALQIYKKEGSFQKSGTLYLKFGSLRGKIIAKKKYSAKAKSVTIYFLPDLETGVEVIYPMIIGDNGWRSYSNPIIFYSEPMTNQNSTNLKKLGHVFGTVNGVEVKCNGVDSEGKINQTIEDWRTVHIYQCVQFVRNYNNAQYGLNISGGDAGKWFTNSTVNKHFHAYKNGGSVAPMPGDVICFNGHVGIIIEVTSSYIKFAQQNGGRTQAIGEKIEFTKYGSNGYTLKNWAGYYVQGWLHPKELY